MNHLTLRFLSGPVLGAALGVAAFLTPRTAHAFDLGVGAMGTAGGNFLDKPSRTALNPDTYPGFAGLTIGGGLMVDGRILDGLLGLEVDVLRTSDKGSGNITFTSPFGNLTEKVSIGQGAWHLPVLAKLAIPSPLIAPEFFIGPEFVFPSNGTMTLDPELPAGSGLTLQEKASTYVMVTGGLGIEIKVPLPVLDLRIPVGLRLSYTPSVPSKFDDRVHASVSSGTVTYQSEWKFAVNATLGAAIYF